MFAIDREALSRQPERAAMKPVVMAAEEFIDSFDANRWEKLAPGKPLPGQSALRLLQISDGQYAKVYERASEYLFSMRIVEEKKKQKLKANTVEVLSAGKTTSGDDLGSWSGMEGGLDLDASLQAEIEGLMEALADPVPEPPKPTTPAPAAPPQVTSKSGATSAPKSRPATTSFDEDFGFNKKTASTPAPARVVSPNRKMVAPPPMANANSARAVAKFSSAVDSAVDAEALIRDILGLLVGDGLFQKSALIVVAKDKKKALVVAARGRILPTDRRS